MMAQAEDYLESIKTLNRSDKIILSAKNGDSRAISDLYNQYKPLILNYLYHRLGDMQIAEELTTEVFIRMINNLPKYKHKNVPFQVWLFKIARNLLIDHYRVSKNYNHVQLQEEIVGNSDLPEIKVEKNMEAEKLRKAICKLTSDQSDVITLRFIADMPINQVAKVLKKSEGAVKMLQTRGLQALNKMMK